MPIRWKWIAAFLFLGLLVASAAERLTIVPKWERFEREFRSSVSYQNPLNEVNVAVVFTSPSGQSVTVDAFWDGGRSWKVRFSPKEVGKWLYTVVCSDQKNRGLEGQSGSFVCTAARNRDRFSKHGPVQVSGDGRFLLHQDGTPFFWLADTAWNGALMSTPAEWETYLQTRTEQGFTAVQWVTTQWRAAPNGNRQGQKAFSGRERIQVNPAFFRELDRKVEAANRAGLLNVPVLLWAIGSGTNPRVNPGFDLPEDQAILLAKYMVARWGANDVVWILGGDGDYRGKNAERWQRIGRAVFGSGKQAPVIMHPGGMHWILNEFLNERWMSIHGYQSGHGDNEATLKWLVQGPPAQDWKKQPARPFINLEPPYENHLAYQSKQPISAQAVRRAVYWSLLVHPTAGVSYGGHGVWGWDDGSKPPTDHPNSGTPLPWREALRMPGAEQMSHVASLFHSVPFWRLRPAPELLAVQPGDNSPKQFVAASRTVEGSCAVVYTPVGGTISLNPSSLPPLAKAVWFNPRTGASQDAKGESARFKTPDNQDWVLVLR